MPTPAPPTDAWMWVVLSVFSHIYIYTLKNLASRGYKHPPIVCYIFCFQKYSFCLNFCLTFVKLLNSIINKVCWRFWPVQLPYQAIKNSVQQQTVQYKPECQPVFLSSCVLVSCVLVQILNKLSIILKLFLLNNFLLQNTFVIEDDLMLKRDK